MSTLNSRPKSPSANTPSKKDDRDESFWDKIGTLGRKKKIKEGKLSAMLWSHLLKTVQFSLFYHLWSC